MSHIIIEDEPPRHEYTVGGTPTDEFAVTFAYFDEDDLVVYVDEVLKVRGVDYTVANDTTSEGGYDGGTITFGTPLTNVEVVIVRSTVRARSTDFPNAGEFNMAALNTQLDQIVAMIQEIHSRSERTLHFNEAVSGYIEGDGHLPPHAPGKGLKWDAVEEKFINTTYDIDFDIAVATAAADSASDSADAAAASAAAAAVLTTMDAFTDTDITGLTNGDVLVYNSVTGFWENTPATAAVATGVSTVVTAFDGILSATENTVQKALDVLDDHGHPWSDISGAPAFITDITGEAIGDLSDVDMTGLTNGMHFKYNSTSGNWEVGVPSESEVLQKIRTTSNVLAYSTDNVIGFDDTDPTGEGLLIAAFNTAITPTAAGNIIRVEVDMPLVSTDDQNGGCVVLDKDGTAVQVMPVYTDSEKLHTPGRMVYEVSAPDTTTMNFKIYVGTSRAGGVTNEYHVAINGTCTNRGILPTRIFNGQIIASLLITEVQAY